MGLRIGGGVPVQWDLTAVPSCFRLLCGGWSPGKDWNFFVQFPVANRGLS